MGELDRVTQRHLQDRDPELDPMRGDAERAEHDERIQSRPAATDRVGHPDPGKAAPFDLPGVVDDASERPTAGLGAGTHEGHHTQSHDRLPSENIAVTPILLSSLAGCPGDNATHLPRRPTADCSDRLCAKHDRRPPAVAPTCDFPRPREDTGKTRFRTALEPPKFP